MIKFDKLLHLLTWNWFTLCFLLLLHFRFDLQGFWLYFLVDTIAVLLGIAKEIYDVRKENLTGFSIGDLLADCAGIITANLYFYLVVIK